MRFPNGAQCAFGGYGASFIELCVQSFNLTISTFLFCMASKLEEDDSDALIVESNQLCLASVFAAAQLPMIKNTVIRIKTA